MSAVDGARPDGPPLAQSRVSRNNLASRGISSGRSLELVARQLVDRGEHAVAEPCGGSGVALGEVADDSGESASALGAK